MKCGLLARTKRNSFEKNRWMGVPQNQLPCFLVQKETLSLETDALTVYMVLLHIHRGKMLRLKPAKRSGELFARVTVGQKRLMEYTGYSINTITHAVKSLIAAGLVETCARRKKKNDYKAKRRHENGGSKAYEYYLLNPDLMDREPLMPQGQTNVIPANGIKYFTYPSSIITNIAEKWSLAKMSGSEIRLYISILWLANKYRSNDFHATVADLQKLSGLSRKTALKALEELHSNRGLTRFWPADNEDHRSKKYRVELCDPLTGDPIPQSDDPRDHPSNYRLRARNKRPTLNNLDAEQVRELICTANEYRGETVSPYGDNGELMMRCPFHEDSTPSLSASTVKNGCWQCFGCKCTGSLSQLLAQLNGTTIGESIQAIAAANGQHVEYREPDRNFTIYKYRNAQGKVLKEVLRGTDKNGSKTFRQRRSEPGGVIWNVEGIGPLLYNMDLLEGAEMVCIVEGEKDADTLTNLQLFRWPKQLIGVTSGGADSWDASLARYLHGKKVIVMPDADEPGKRYQDAVTASLEAEGIDYMVVSFEGTGHKDVTEYLTGYTVGDLVRLIGVDCRYLPASTCGVSSTHSRDAPEHSDITI